MFVHLWTKCCLFAVHDENGLLTTNPLTARPLPGSPYCACMLKICSNFGISRSPYYYNLYCSPNIESVRTTFLCLLATCYTIVWLFWAILEKLWIISYYREISIQSTQSLPIHALVRTLHCSLYFYFCNNFKYH